MVYAAACVIVEFKYWDPIYEALKTIIVL